MTSRNEELIRALLDGQTLTDFIPLSRTEAYLKACINKTGVDNLPMPISRIDVLLLELASVLAEGSTAVKSTIAKIADGSITTITSSDLAGATKIGDYAFYGLSSLTSVEIPSSVLKICNRSFAYCSSLKSIVIPTNVVEIEANSFRYCDALTDITIEGANITIEADAFNTGSETNKVTIKMLSTTPPTITTTSFKTSTLEKIEVPVGCGTKYKTAANWSAYANYIVEATA